MLEFNTQSATLWSVLDVGWAAGLLSRWGGVKDGRRVLLSLKLKPLLATGSCVVSVTLSCLPPSRVGVSQSLALCVCVSATHDS